MTAKRIAELALEIGQTQSLIGEERKATAVCLQALGLIAKYGNVIPDEYVEPKKEARNA